MKKMIKPTIKPTIKPAGDVRDLPTRRASQIATSWMVAISCFVALMCCSCKNLPRPASNGAIPSDSTAALTTAAGTSETPARQPLASAPVVNRDSIANAPVANIPASKLSSQPPATLIPSAPNPVVASANQADYVTPAYRSGGASEIQKLAHTNPTAPMASTHVAARRPQTLAPVVDSPSLSTPVAPGAPTVIPAPTQTSPPQGRVMIEGDQVYMDSPPAGLEYEWRPVAACGCNPSCGPGVACQGARPFSSPDEFVCDGGDVKAQVRVMKNFDVRNIDMTDTVAHFDTLDGQRLVERSNRVCIYAPRFAAVRRVDRALAEESLKTAAGIDRRLKLSGQDRHAIVGSLLQPVQAEGRLGRMAANALLEKEGGLDVENIYSPLGTANPVPPFENFEIIQRGVYLNSDKPRLHEHVEAALVWMTYPAVEVMINQRKAQQVEQKSRAQETVLYELDGKPRLRICKVASTDNAKPGDVVDFTIRFDNIGDQKIGNVTILDSLTTRLEYVPESQTCSVDAEFFSIENEGQSLVLRWEVDQPLKVGEGGIVRFKCRVR